MMKLFSSGTLGSLLGPIAQLLGGAAVYGKAWKDRGARERINELKRQKADVELRNQIDQRVRTASSDERMRLRKRWTTEP